MRLIDADKLEITKLAEFNDEYGDAVPVYGVMAEDIDNAPTVDAIVLPVKVGQTVWFVPMPNDSKGIIETWVEKVVAKAGGLYIKMAVNAQYETTCNSIGKTVFLTREAAEAALKARENK